MTMFSASPWRNRLNMLDLLRERARGRYVRTAARVLFKRPLAIRTNVPLISFTFDDFPRSALLTGGKILEEFGVRGTYYASFGLMGNLAPTGAIFLPEDAHAAIGQGHELGCHTFGHCDAAKTQTSAFEASIIQNRKFLNGLLDGVSFRTLSYPISQPRARTKEMVARHFVCCRGGGQTFNTEVADLNCLSAFFLEKSRDNPDAVAKVIEQNAEECGWLIFATHDVSNQPTPYGCSPEFFKTIVRKAVESGARILPVIEACEALRTTPA